MGIGYDYRKVWDRTWNWKYVLTLAGDVEIGGFIFLPLINTHFSQLSFPHVKWSNITSRAPPFPGAVLCTHTMYFVHRRCTLHTRSLHRHNLGIPGELSERYFTPVDIFSHILQHWAIHVQSCFISFPFKIVVTLNLRNKITGTSTASLKNSTDMSAPSTRFPNYEIFLAPQHSILVRIFGLQQHSESHLFLGHPVKCK